MAEQDEPKILNLMDCLKESVKREGMKRCDPVGYWRIRAQEIAGAACAEAKQATQPIPSESVWRALCNHFDEAVNMMAALRLEHDEAHQGYGDMLVRADAAEKQLAAARASLRAAEQALRESEEIAWNALGKPHGTYETTNVQRLAGDAAKMREALTALLACLNAPNPNNPEQWMVAPGQGAQFSRCVIEVRKALAPRPDGAAAKDVGVDHG